MPTSLNDALQRSQTSHFHPDGDFFGADNYVDVRSDEEFLVD